MRRIGFLWLFGTGGWFSCGWGVSGFGLLVSGFGEFGYCIFFIGAHEFAAVAVAFFLLEAAAAKAGIVGAGFKALKLIARVNGAEELHLAFLGVGVVAHG